LKTSFEQILSAPIIVECVFAELGTKVSQDVLARVNFDGTYRFEDKGVVVVHTDHADETAAASWLREQLSDDMGVGAVRRLALAAWQALTADKPFAPPTTDGTGEMVAPGDLGGRVIECALLDRRISARVRYRGLEPAELS
jgi:20S proteasome alpha/beta subunit